VPVYRLLLSFVEDESGWIVQAYLPTTLDDSVLFWNMAESLWSWTGLEWTADKDKLVRVCIVMEKGKAKRLLLSVFVLVIVVSLLCLEHEQFSMCLGMGDTAFSQRKYDAVGVWIAKKYMLAHMVTERGYLDTSHLSTVSILPRGCRVSSIKSIRPKTFCS
jgi:hypothetical protein